MLEYAKRFSMQQEPDTPQSCNGQEYDSDDEEATLKRAMDMSNKGKEDTPEAMGSATESSASMPPPTDPTDLPDPTYMFGMPTISGIPCSQKGRQVPHCYAPGYPLQQDWVEFQGHLPALCGHLLVPAQRLRWKSDRYRDYISSPGHRRL